MRDGSRTTRLAGAALLALGLGLYAADAPQPLPPAAAGKVDFARDVAPLLQKHCVNCHGADRPKAGLRLDTRDGALKGGYAGAVLTPGKSAASRLVHVVAGVAEDEVVMPPRGPRLTPQQVGLVRAWIDQGAAWPDGLTLAAPAKEPPTWTKHWAFQPLRRPAVPDVQRRDWCRNAIDRFVLARLEQEGVEPAPEADAATLIRRVTLDLTGLPPTPEEVQEFVQAHGQPSAGPDAYERLVDRLLCSPHYGERWARPWLDLCHYADTDGYLQDMLRPVAWRYRQWLIDALNADLPFDQFTVQQLAGDLLLKDEGGRMKDEKRQAAGSSFILPPSSFDALLATGFLRNTLSNREGGADLEEYRVEQVVDRVQMVAAGWLGVTVGCARCHDHKFDPISQREFFGLYAFLDGGDEVNVYAPLPGERERFEPKYAEYRKKRDELLAPLAKEIAELQARWEKRVLEAEANPGKDAHWDRQWEILGLIWGNHLGEGQLEACQMVRAGPAGRSEEDRDRLLVYFLQNGSSIDEKRFKELKLGEVLAKLLALRKEVPWPTRAPVMRETPVPRPVRLHVRGDFRVPGVEVKPATPGFVPTVAGLEPNRLGLARWLVAPENPLPPRVTVNRYWQEFFGRGLVATPEDFGTRGEPPSHPELLDWLASEFRSPSPSPPGRGEGGVRGAWSMKDLCRLIVTSATYRQSSRARPELTGRDPHNRLLARQLPLRLTADQVRDTTLAVSGLLYRKVGGPSVFPPQPPAVAMEAFDHKWEPSPGPERYRRGVYTFLQRLSPFAQGVTFDAPPLSRACTRRERSNTPLQALTLLNDPAFFEAARALAARLAREAPGSPEDRIDHLFRLCLARPPSPAERQRLRACYDEELALAKNDAAAAWTAVCSVVLNLHEFITRD